MSITVKNSSDKPVRSAGFDFKPGDNKVTASKLSAAKRCQINANPHLTISEAAAAKSTGESK